VKILIADDDAIPRRLLHAALVKAGHEVVSTCDGAEAWQVLQRVDAPRLVILDWLMPGLDGVEICRRVRQRDVAPYTYLLLLTSKDRKEDLITGLEAGADDYLTKPFDPPRAYGAEGRTPEHRSREAQRAACRSAAGRRSRPPLAAASAESEGPILPVIRRERVCVFWRGGVIPDLIQLWSSRRHSSIGWGGRRRVSLPKYSKLTG
jgi:CheY-like chemotaxis protein